MSVALKGDSIGKQNALPALGESAELLRYQTSSLFSPFYGDSTDELCLCCSSGPNPLSAFVTVPIELHDFVAYIFLTLQPTGVAVFPTYWAAFLVSRSREELRQVRRQVCSLQVL